MVGIVLLGVFVLLLALGAPIAVCLGMSSVSAILVQGAGKPLEAIMSVLPRLCSSGAVSLSCWPSRFSSCPAT